MTQTNKMRATAKTIATTADAAHSGVLAAAVFLLSAGVFLLLSAA